MHTSCELSRIAITIGPSMPQYVYLGKTRSAGLTEAGRAGERAARISPDTDDVPPPVRSLARHRHPPASWHRPRTDRSVLLGPRRRRGERSDPPRPSTGSRAARRLASRRCLSSRRKPPSAAVGHGSRRCRKESPRPHRRRPTSVPGPSRSKTEGPPAFSRIPPVVMDSSRMCQSPFPERTRPQTFRPPCPARVRDEIVEQF